MSFKSDGVSLIALLAAAAAVATDASPASVEGPMSEGRPANAFLFM